MKSKTPPTPQRQLMIKTKACQRLIKEVSYYEKEVLENETKLKEMRDQGKNPFDIKKFEEVLSESHMMVPDSKNRLEQALSDLATYYTTYNTDTNTALADDEWFTKAGELLQQQQQQQQQQTEGGGGGTIDGVGAAAAADVVEETDVSGLREGEAF